MLGKRIECYVIDVFQYDILNSQENMFFTSATLRYFELTAVDNCEDVMMVEWLNA